MTEDASTDINKKLTKFRSPNYPFIGLEDAIAKAEIVKEEGGLHEVPFRAAMDAWKYKSGSTSQTIAALKAFGLVTVTGEGDARKIKLTERARKILSHHSESSDLLKEAAVSPNIYKDLWDHYDGQLPPSDKVISEYLEFDKKFNPDVIKGVIKDFRASIAYAKLSTSDTIDSNEDGEDEESQEQETGEEDQDSGSKIRKAMTLPKGIMFKASVEMNTEGHLDVVFAGVSNRKTMTLLNEIYGLCEKYDPQPLEQTSMTVSTPAQLIEANQEDDSG